MTPNKILEAVQNDYEKILKNRRFLHAHAETGFDLSQTLAYVKQELESMGYTPIPCGKAGLIALAGGKRPGKVFLLRADMDALPIREEAAVDFVSENGNMHACGHDMHTAMLLEAARIFKSCEDEICGTVKLMFQPGEEILEGANDMITSGVLENPPVNAGLMIHVMTGMPLPSGTAIVCDGGISAPAADFYTINIQGKGCHGSMPWKGIDPITAAAHIILALQELLAREIAPMEGTALTIGSIHAGVAANAIPDTAMLRGTLRTFDDEIREQLKKRLVEIVSHTAAAFQAEATVTFDSGCPTLQNDCALSDCTVKYIQELNGSHMAFTAGALAAKAGGNASKSNGSEDFAYVSHHIPTIMLALAAGSPEDGYTFPLHHPMVKFDEDALPVGGAIYAYVAMRWLEEHSI